MTPLRRLVIAAALLCGCAACYGKAPRVVDLGTDIRSEIPLCGIWRIGVDGAVFEIRTAGIDGIYSLYLLSSPDFTIPSGTLFGTMKYTGTGRNYDVTLLAHPAGKNNATLTGKRHNFIFEFADSGDSFVMHAYRKGRRVNISRLLPYLMRVSVTSYDTRPNNIDGGRRIGPPAPPSRLSL